MFQVHVNSLVSLNEGVGSFGAGTLLRIVSIYGEGYQVYNPQADKYLVVKREQFSVIKE
jgi:hypothetical protein